MKNKKIWKALYEMQPFKVMNMNIEYRFANGLFYKCIPKQYRVRIYLN